MLARIIVGEVKRIEEVLQNWKATDLVGIEIEVGAVRL